MLLLILLALLIYATRLIGFFVTVELHPFALRFLHYLPIAIFAAFAASGVIQPGNDGMIRIIAALFAGFVVWRTHKLWQGFIVGMSILWLLILAS